MFTANHAVGYITHRAIVRTSNASTGICQVEIPELTGAGILTTVSNIGLSIIAGLYNVPAIGSTVFVASNRVSDRVFFVSEQRNGIADTLSTPLVTSKGGTGASVYVAGDTIYAATTGASAFTRLAKGTANQVVGMNAAATAPEYKTVAGTTDQVVVTHAANSVTLSTPQSINTTSAPTFASITLNAATGAKVTMSGATSNWLEWNTNGVAAPTFTTRSAGTKVVLYPTMSTFSSDYALGIESGVLWSSVPTTGSSFKWYGGTDVAATLTGAGALTVTGAISAASFNSTGAISATGALSSGNATINGGTSPVMLLGSTWPSGNTYAAITVTGMGGTGYGMLMSTTDTFISSGSGSTYLRGPSNSSSQQIQLTSSAMNASATTINLNPTGRVALNSRNTLLPVDYQQYVLPATLVNPTSFQFLMNGITTTVKDGDYLEICWHCRWDSGSGGSQFQAQPQVYYLSGGTVTIAQRIFATYTTLSSNTLSCSTMFGPITTAGATGTAITVTISGGTVSGTGSLILTETWFTVQVLSAR